MLVKIDPDVFDVDIHLSYGTKDNFTGKIIYHNPVCFLHEEAATKLQKAVIYAKALGKRLLIFDAFRPKEAQSLLWESCPSAEFVTPPEKGSPHSRGVAIDLTLLDEKGKALDMGTGFDDFTQKSHHTYFDFPKEILQNRHLLLSIMTLAGWDFYRNEWWHYQLFDSKSYPLFSDHESPIPLMQP